MIPTCEQMRSTISITCVVTKTVPPLLTYPSSNSRITRLVTTSTPSKGSSRNSNDGLGSSAAASASFFFMPCEYSTVSFFSTPSSCSSESNSSPRSIIVFLSSWCICPTKVRYSRALRLSNSARSSGTTPIFCLTSIACFAFQGSPPSNVTEPDEGLRMPVSILMVVDLPAPLGPRKPYNVPDSTAKSTEFTA